MATYLLVHGAWHSGQCWERVVPLLTAAGHDVLTPSLTGHGEYADLLTPDVDLDTHIQDVAGLIVERDLTDVVLVGHSYAGMVISGVAHMVPDRIAQLVFIDAMVPSDGEAAADLYPDMVQYLIDLAEASGTGWRVPPLPEMPPPVGLFGVNDPADMAWLRSILSDLPIRCLQQPVRLDNPAAALIPRSHIHCVVGQAADRRPVSAVQPNGAPARVWELQTGHDCMITAPVELSGLLLQLG
jgi:pimeloyl-ACP methyl ester carboxylesterase